jgi:hypothetical protein
MDGNLGTTNLLLGIMAAVSALQGLLLIGACIAGWKLYRQTTELMSLVEARHVAPTMARVHVILDHVTAVAQRMRNDTEQVERAIRHTIDRVDGTAQRVKADVRVKTSWIVGAVRGVTVALQEMLRDRPATQTHNEYTTPGRTH